MLFRHDFLTKEEHKLWDEAYNEYKTNKEVSNSGVQQGDQKGTRDTSGGGDEEAAHPQRRFSRVYIGGWHNIRY
jgi:hypothetical protein